MSFKKRYVTGVSATPVTYIESSLCGVASMMTYLIRRIFWLIPVLFFVALITFTLMHAAPGGPWDRDLRRTPGG